MSKHTFSDQIRSTAKMVLFSMLLVFGLALPGMAQDYGAPEGQQDQQEYTPPEGQQEQQQDPWEQQQQAAPADFSDQEVDNAASAYVDIIDIREQYQQQLAEVDDPEAAQDIQMEANEKITQAVEDNGIDVETYNDIITAAQADEGLMNELLEKIDAMQ